MPEILSLTGCVYNPRQVTYPKVKSANVMANYSVWSYGEAYRRLEWAPGNALYTESIKCC